MIDSISYELYKFIIKPPHSEKDRADVQVLIDSKPAFDLSIRYDSEDGFKVIWPKSKYYQSIPESCKEILNGEVLQHYSDWLESA